MKKHPVFVTTALALLAAAGSARATVIDFENLAGVAMPNNAGSPVPPQSQLSTQLHSSTGAVFSSTASYVSIVDLGLGHATSGSIGLGGADSLGRLNYADPIIVEFFDPSNILTPVMVGSASIRGDLSLSNGADIHMDAYDVGGTLVASDTELDGLGATLSVTHPSIHRLVIYADIPNVGWDDLEFPTIPEPATLSLLLFGGMAILRRRAGRA